MLTREKVIESVAALCIKGPPAVRGHCWACDAALFILDEGRLTWAVVEALRDVRENVGSDRPEMWVRVNEALAPWAKK